MIFENTCRERGDFAHADHFDRTDDSHLNCKHAEARGWTTVHLVEPCTPIPRIPASRYLVSSLHELPMHFPDVFKSQEADTA
jgi:hypothetical protein